MKLAEKIVALVITLLLIVFYISNAVANKYNTMKEQSEKQEQAKYYIEKEINNIFNTYYHSNSLGEKTDDAEYNVNKFYVVSNNKLYLCTYSIDENRLIINDEGDLPIVVYGVVEE